MPDLALVNGDNFSGAARHDGAVIHAWIKGSADFAALDALEMLLTRTHAEASRLGIGEVVIDLRELELLSSSCFKSLVAWIHDIQELPEDRQYKVTVRSSAKFAWQKRSLQSLRGFAAELITVIEEP